MQDKVYRFGSCMLRLASRELVVHGAVQLVEPKAFDVLAYLVEQHRRVVSKDELLDQVWRGRVVSIGVVARAVMKARQAIRDDGVGPALIKTVPRVGYRFVGGLETLGAGASPERSAGASALERPGTAARPIGPGSMVLALLPFENGTGLTELDWVELGLMSMVAQALGVDARLFLPPIAGLLTALGTLPARATSQEKEATVRRLLGASTVVHARVTREGSQFVLDCSIATAQRTERIRLLGPELTQLGQRLGTEVRAALFADDPARTPLTYESTDPLVNQAMARALQAAAEQKWRVAVNLFQVVLDIEPLNVRARLEHLRALALLGDEAALPLAEALLAHAQATGDTRLAVATHALLGLTYRNRSLYEPAREHLNQVVRMAEVHALPNEAAMALNLLVGIAILERDFVRARQLLDEAERVVMPASDRIDHVRLLANAALVAAKLGNPLRSIELGRKAARLSSEYRLGGNFVIASLNLVNPCVDLGLMRDAVRHGEESVAGAREAGDPFRIAITTAAVCWLYRELRAPKQSARVLAQALALDVRAPSPRAALLLAQGHHAAGERDHHRAAELVRQAIAIHREMKTWLSVHESTPWMIMSLALSGQTGAALDACTQARAFPGFGDDPDLRAALRYCEALIMHARRAREDARRALAEVLDTAPMGVWRAYACLDSAWLAVEDGQTSAARYLLRDLATWLEEHPVGMAVDARLKYATAEYAAAHEAQQWHAARVESAMPAYYDEVARVYRDAADRPPASPSPLAPIPWLPSAM